VDNDDDNLAHSGALSGGWSHPGEGNENDNSEGEEDMQCGEKGTRHMKGTKDRKEKGNGNGKGKGIVK
jgi:hypothetical protein